MLSWLLFRPSLCPKLGGGAKNPTGVRMAGSCRSVKGTGGTGRKRLDLGFVYWSVASLVANWSLSLSKSVLSLALQPPALRWCVVFVCGSLQTVVKYVTVCWCCVSFLVWILHEIRFGVIKVRVIIK